MNRKYDINGRKLLAEICIGKGMDMGCGDKKITENCIGVDWDTSVKPDIEYDINFGIFEEGQLDFIVCSHALEHVENVNLVLIYWQQMLKEGGKIGILVPHGEYINPETLGSSEGTHHYLFTPITLKIYLEHARFKDVKIQVVKRTYAWHRHPAIVAIGKK